MTPTEGQTNLGQFSSLGTFSNKRDRESTVTRDVPQREVDITKNALYSLAGAAAKASFIEVRLKKRLKVIHTPMRNPQVTAPKDINGKTSSRPVTPGSCPMAINFLLNPMSDVSADATNRPLTPGSCPMAINFLLNPMSDVPQRQIQNVAERDRVKITFPDGIVYEGQWKNGVPHGQGKKTRKLMNGNLVYEGQWKNGKRHGQGKLTYKIAIYEGEWQSGKQHGQGKLTFKNGVVYEGQFQNERFHGHGKATFKNGVVYEGQFQNGKPHGHGIAYKYGKMLTQKWGNGMLVWNLPIPPLLPNRNSPLG